jgi:TonB family protein
VIRIEALWLSVAPLDMRAGMDTTLAQVVRVFGEAWPHHGRLALDAYVLWICPGCAILVLCSFSNGQLIVGGYVKWQYWSGGLIVSVLIHLVVFWPAPDVKYEWVKATPLSVHFVPVSPLELAPEGDGRADCCEARSLPSDDSSASSTKKRGRQRLAAEVVRKPEVMTIQQGREPVSLAAIERVISNPGTPEQVVDVVLLSDQVVSSGVSLARYRFALAAAAVRMQKYPQAAMAAGLEGTVAVDVRLAAESVAPLISVGRSSGIEELDREAVLLLTRAVMSLPAWQAPLGDGVSIRLPVHFELQGR